MGRLSPADFRAVYGFRRPDVRLFERSHQVCGLDYPFTIPRKLRSLGAARLVSTPSRLEHMAELGSGLPFEVSPTLSSSASPVSQASTQVFLKSAAYAIPPRPRAAALLSDLMIGHVARFYTSVFRKLLPYPRPDRVRCASLLSWRDLVALQKGFDKGFSPIPSWVTGRVALSLRRNHICYEGR